MGNIDLKRALMLAMAAGLLVLGAVYFLSGPGSNIPPAGGLSAAPATAQAGKRMAPPPPPATKGANPPPAAQRAEVGTNIPPETPSTPPAAAVEKPIRVPLSTLGAVTSGRDLSDPFQGFTAELVRLKKEAEILESKIKILELKAKEAEARLKEKRAQGLTAMIEKDPKILLNLPGDTGEGGGITLGQQSRLQAGLPQSSKGIDEDLKNIMRERTPTVKMVILGRDKRVTVDYQGDTFTLSVGDKVRDIEVLNVTPRGAIFKLNGKQEFIPVSESPLSREKKEETAQIEKPRRNLTERP